jgi:transitional endoplasmic reticulum ATPase
MASKLKLTCDATVEGGVEDDSLVSVPNKVISDAGYVPGDTVLIRGKKGKDTLCILVADDSGEKDKIRMSSVTRRNLGLALGDSCVVSPPTEEVNFATTVRVLPYDDSIKGNDFDKNASSLKFDF